MSARVVVVPDLRDIEPAPADVVLDLAALTAALRGDGPHVRLVALRALRAAKEAAAGLDEPVVVFVLHPDATLDELDAYRARGWLVAFDELMVAELRGFLEHHNNVRAPIRTMRERGAHTVGDLSRRDKPEGPTDEARAG